MSAEERQSDEFDVSTGDIGSAFSTPVENPQDLTTHDQPNSNRPQAKSEKPSLPTHTERIAIKSSSETYTDDPNSDKHTSKTTKLHGLISTTAGSHPSTEHLSGPRSDTDSAIVEDSETPAESITGSNHSVQIDEHVHVDSQAPHISRSASPVTQVSPKSEASTNSTTLPNPTEHHRQGSSVLTTLSTSITLDNSGALSSMVFVVQALECIEKNKDTRRRTQLYDAVRKALGLIRKQSLRSPSANTVFEPLRLACESNQSSLMKPALDCIAKLASYDFFVDPPPPPPAPLSSIVPVQRADTPTTPILERVVDTVCACFQGEVTDDAVQVQIIKALLAIVLVDRKGSALHQGSLLRAVRQTYNIFLLSRNATNQHIAQGALTQIIDTVFGRVRIQKEKHEDISNVDLEIPVSGTEEDIADAGEEKTVGSELPEGKATGSRQNRMTLHASSAFITDQSASSDDEQDLVVKDAFLVFRSMCKLSLHSLTPESAADPKSHAMRSKILSLSTIHSILSSHISIFTDPRVLIRSSSSQEKTTFMQASKQYICLSLSRNSVSHVQQVFEISCNIYTIFVTRLRNVLKKEIEVFTREIFLPILEMRTSSWQQKQYLLSVFTDICRDPRALVEIYLNYDCDRSTLDNVYERIMNVLSKISATVVNSRSQQQSQSEQYKHAGQSDSLPSSVALDTSGAVLPVEYHLRRQALECIVAVLRSLVEWSETGMAAAIAINLDGSERLSGDTRSEDLEARRSSGTQLSTGTRTPSSTSFFATNSANESKNGVLTLVDDPTQFETQKHFKNALLDGIRSFNYKPKRGIALLIKQGFVKSDSPNDIAHFLLTTEGLSKAVIGNYLGEPDQANIATMHAFVDLQDFSNLDFVPALRRFLQAFRLPGEAQKIDRFLLKFAGRYVEQNPKEFSNADAAYVLAYSVTMLNTDAHNPQVKKRMTKPEFIKNNRGINDGGDLPQEMLSAVYNDIQQNEIVMQEEQTAAILAGAMNVTRSGIAAGIGNALASVGRDMQREAYVLASEEMANKTEALFRNIIKTQRKSGLSESIFYSATHFEHAGPMFEAAWMPFLAALSGTVQDSNDVDNIRACMDGFRLSIRISSLFGLDLARRAFVGALAKFTFLSNLSEMKLKNVEAIKTLLSVGFSEGNRLRDSWKEILTCVSRLERLQLITSGIDENAVPDSALRPQIMYVTRSALLTLSRSSSETTRSFTSLHLKPKTFTSGQFAREVADLTQSREILHLTDKIFTKSAELSGEAIVDFVRALSEVSWGEIQSSGLGEHPRMYSLQKVVEVSYYNMDRIRMEWSNIWVGTHPNTAVVYFAMDSLRQLSMRFLEIDELPFFKFQKDFLKPFEYVMSHNSAVTVKDMILRCLHQMIQTRGHRIKSGWRTMFCVFAIASREIYESVVSFAFENIKTINNDYFLQIFAHGSYPDLAVCLTELAKNQRFQKFSLQALEILKGTIPNVLARSECPLYENSSLIKSDSADADPTVRFWFPVLFGFHDILMTGDDLEVRSKALTYLFDTITNYGDGFSNDFWDLACRQLLFPIFKVLKSRSEVSRFHNDEDMTIWLSTTMIQALRNMIALFTHYFARLHQRLDGFLELLVSCICQENDTLARIGSSCLQSLILENVHKLQPDHWTLITNAFVNLFETTTPRALFTQQNEVVQTHSSENSLRINGAGVEREGNNNIDDSRLTQLQSPADSDTVFSREEPHISPAKRKEFKQTIVKCVLQLLMIDTLSELFSSHDVYNSIPSAHILILMGELKKSYEFAKTFNNDLDLRNHLLRIGFMKQLPNLLRQESNSAATYINILIRMYNDPQEDRIASKTSVEEALIPLSFEILRNFSKLSAESQQRNIAAWAPVVAEILQGVAEFSEQDFNKSCDTFYPLSTDLILMELSLQVRSSLHAVFKRMGSMRFSNKSAIS
ncbi:Protein transport protein sec72 [Neolecta irregularis DAH-3]|uniref:Protein transport protein sec72 n=1 Tax=Neolecta irregularis (strain DAH-3) TaxID=1198029 RepID=A0A1U7LGJ0_NEOID|nr:Protein transport protein sec72 [Neolecta irregularis DAH-3]|eukprot:OLL21713.1 Protein transport protein sec72 [Neolecta irregularis DAH-3]